jgi:hypothetical protein
MAKIYYDKDANIEVLKGKIMRRFQILHYSYAKKRANK